MSAIPRRCRSVQEPSPVCRPLGARKKDTPEKARLLMAGGFRRLMPCVSFGGGVG
nr:MAG TPA: hypothetical protein [Caudoviricetes sp.]